MIRQTILIVDDEKNVVLSVARMLSLEGYDVLRAHGGAESLELLKSNTVDLVLLDVMMPGQDGIETLQQILSREPDLPVVMMSAHGTIETAVRATQAGARDFLEKPLSTEKTLVAIGNLLRLSHLERETASLKASVEPERRIVGRGPALQRVRDMIERVGPTDGRVLLTGESGTGKELVARAIHELSPRRQSAFVTVNCAAIPGELIESELFGHEKGAFTGAVKSRAGRFEQAHRGTLFLDEIGDMPLLAQSKLLRVLETGEVDRVGGTAPRRVDARVISATNKDLARAVSRNEFREDLFHRLNVVPIHLPALRDRVEDLPELVEHLLRNLSRVHGRRPHAMDPDALARLVNRPWPGNIRELRNALERLVILTPGSTITVSDIEACFPAGGPRSAGDATPPATGTLRDMLRDFEKGAIERSLLAQDGNVAATARALGLERSHLYKKMRELGVERTDE